MEWRFPISTPKTGIALAAALAAVAAPALASDDAHVQNADEIRVKLADKGCDMRESSATTA